MPGLKLQDNAFDTALVLWPVTPISVLDKLRDVFRTVSYFPVQGPAAAPDATKPSMDDYARADAIFAFSMPPALTHPDQTPRLKLFQCCSSGVSHLEGTDFFRAAQAERRDIAWANASGIQTTTIAEHVLGTVLMLTHKLAFLHLAAQNEQRWVPHAELGGNFIRELNTLVVGVIGYGNIGRETARLFRGCGATVVALTRHGVPQPATGYSLPSTGDPDGSVPTAYYSSTSRESRHAFFGACDVVVNTLPESERTIGTMETDEFTAMKGDAIYVNVGRGTTTDQEALVRALTAQPQEGEERSATGTLRIGAASLDVVNPEPLPSSSPLYALPNVILTPHMSALSAQYWSRAIDVLRTNVERLGRGEEGVNVFAGPGRESK